MGPRRALLVGPQGYPMLALLFCPGLGVATSKCVEMVSAVMQWKLRSIYVFSLVFFQVFLFICMHLLFLFVGTKWNMNSISKC